MDQDDPEKRIADLEHQSAEQKRDASQRTWSEALLLGLGVLCVVVGVAIFIQGVPFLTWTPTAATVERCYSSGGDEYCYGRWTVGGESRTGKILGRLPSGHDVVGSQVDVRAGRDRAFAAGEAGVRYAALAGGLFTIATGLVPLWFWRRRVKYRRAKRTL